jgi:hypothetical protein
MEYFGLQRYRRVGGRAVWCRACELLCAQSVFEPGFHIPISTARCSYGCYLSTDESHYSGKRDRLEVVDGVCVCSCMAWNSVE